MMHTGCRIPFDISAEVSIVNPAEPSALRELGWLRRPQVSNVVLKTPQRKFEEVADADARPQPLLASIPQPVAAPRTPASPSPNGIRRCADFGERCDRKCFPHDLCHDATCLCTGIQAHHIPLSGFSPDHQHLQPG